MERRWERSPRTLKILSDMAYRLTRSKRDRYRPICDEEWGKLGGGGGRGKKLSWEGRCCCWAFVKPGF